MYDAHYCVMKIGVYVTKYLNTSWYWSFVVSFVNWTFVLREIVFSTYVHIVAVICLHISMSTKTSARSLSWIQSTRTVYIRRMEVLFWHAVWTLLINNWYYIHISTTRSSFIVVQFCFAVSCAINHNNNHKLDVQYYLTWSGQNYIPNTGIYLWYLRYNCL